MTASGGATSGSGGAWKNEALVRTFLEGVRGAIPLAAEQIDVMLRLAEAGRTPIKSFADLGCGNGVLSRAILDRHPDASATLVDHSEPMIAEARRHLAPHSGRCRFVTADLADPKWTAALANAAPFDLVVSGYAIHHLADPRKKQLYREICALLNPGGLFLNTEHVKSATPWIEEISDDLLIDRFHEYDSRQGSRKSREQVAEEYVHRPDKAENTLALLEDQCEWLRQCGFEDVDCYFKLFELAIFGGRKPA